MGGICVADECSWAKPCAGTNTCFPIDTDSSICIPSGQIPAGGDCTSNQNGCAQGALCVPIDQQQTKFECIMTCNPAQNTQCTDMDCKDISDSFKRATNSFGICMKKGTVDAYGDCDQNNPCKQPMMCVMLSQNATTGSCLNPCNVKNPQCTDKDEQCLPLQSGGDEGICYKQKPGNVAIDQSCGQAEGNCKEGLICLTLKEGDTSGTCLQKCVPGDTTVICPKAEQSCVPLQSGGGVCYAAPTGNSGKYQECGNDTVGYCKKDLMCVNTEADSKTGTCLSKCDAAKNNTDNTNAECVESGEKCFQLQNGEGICYKPPTGNNEKGAKCGSKAAGHCKEGLLCVLMAQGDTEGTCLTICDPANPQCDTDEQCMGLQGGGGVCSKQGMSTGSNDAGQSCGPKSGGCKTGLLCVKQSQTEEEGKCYISCDPANPSCPMPSQNCAPISAGSGGVCAPP